jgi:aspartate racemase
MKTAGMIGGLGPESTVAYYRAIVDKYRERAQDGSYPSILIDSVDLTRMLALIADDRLDEIAAYLLDELRRLAAAGADFGFLSANTPHVVFDRLREASPIPLISIVEATCARAQALGLTRLGIFGTRYTMRGHFYGDVCTRLGIALFAPHGDDESFVHEKYLGELVNGIFLPETRAALLRIAGQLRDEHAVEGIILGGTELPLLLTEPTHNGIALLDTTAIHADSVVAELLSSG